MIQALFRWDRRPSQASAEALRRVIFSVLTRLGREDAEVHVLVTGDEQIRELNRAFRNLDEATDVLSFPDGEELPTGVVLLGEVVLSIDAARRQAETLGHSELRELEELVLHGVLHLSGYDHIADGGEMNELELEMRAEVLR